MSAEDVGVMEWLTINEIGIAHLWFDKRLPQESYAEMADGATLGEFKSLADMWRPGALDCITRQRVEAADREQAYQLWAGQQKALGLPADRITYHDIEFADGTLWDPGLPTYNLILAIEGDTGPSGQVNLFNARTVATSSTMHEVSVNVGPGLPSIKWLDGSIAHLLNHLLTNDIPTSKANVTFDTVTGLENRDPAAALRFAEFRFPVADPNHHTWGRLLSNGGDVGAGNVLQTLADYGDHVFTFEPNGDVRSIARAGS